MNWLPHLLTFFGDSRCNGGSFFGIPPWYQYLNAAGRLAFNDGSKSCELASQFQFTDLTLIALGVLDILLRLAGLIAVGYVIYGGIQYVISQGEPDKTQKAKQTIINALIGLAITILAASLVAFIGARIG